VCFAADSHPPIAPIAGAAVDGALLTLTSADGNRFSGYRARALVHGPARMLVLPDVRGLFTFYEELALRFAEAGIDSLAIDWFGRTAGLGPRDAEFEYLPHVDQTSWAGLSADIRAGVTELRSGGHDDAHVFVLGFCFGGRLAFDTATLGLDLAGVIGFYGVPQGPRLDIPAPVDVAGSMGCPLLGLFGAADQAIPPAMIESFEHALGAAGVPHELVSYPGAPHSFFDHKAAEFGEASDDAWRRILAFVATHAPA
jgi:carboxymethylenebutenolidase